MLNTNPDSNTTDSQVIAAIGLSLIPIVTVVGNVLVVLAVTTDRGLRTTTNFLLLSLAVADLLVGLLVMPPSVYLVVNNLHWFLSPTFCTIFTFSDVTASTASIVHLTAISADRFFAVLRHIEYATQRHRTRVHVFIMCTWILSILVGLPLVLVLDPNKHSNQSICGIDNYDYMLYGSIFAFYIPAGVMIVLYYLVFSKLHRRLQSVRFQECTAAKVVELTHTMVPDTRTAASRNRPWDMSWAVPYVKSLEDKSRQTGCDNISRRDLKELNTILEKLEKGEDSVTENTQDDGSSAVKSPSPPGSITDSTLPKSSVIKSTSTARSNKLVRKFSSKTRPTMLTAAREQNWKQFFNICGNKLVGRKFNAKRLQILRARAYRLLMKMKSKQGIAIRKENRATKLVATVMLVFLICWVPFFTTNLVKVYFLRTGQFWSQDAEVAFIVFTWLGYLNSAVNPLIYTVINRKFRRAFVRILTCRFRKLSRSRTWGRMQYARRRSTRFASWFISRRETIRKETVGIKDFETCDIDNLRKISKLANQRKVSDLRSPPLPSQHDSDIIL